MRLPYRPFVSSMAYMPIKTVPNLKDHLDYLTITVSAYDGYEGDYRETSVEETDVADEQVVMLYDDSKEGYIGFPREYAREQFGDIGSTDITVSGQADKSLFPDTIKPRNDAQKEFMRNLANMCQQPGPVDIFAKARTGSGKLVTDLWLNAKLGIRTLVVVPTNKLKNQWLGSIKHKNGMRFFWGEEFVEKHVGVIQQDKCDYEDKLICVGLLPSLARRQYDPEVYRYFGKITFDEVHRCGAPMLANVLKKFHCRVRVGYTATARRDALQRVITTHFGNPKVTSSQDVLIPTVKVHTFRSSQYINDRSEGAILSSVAEMPERNNLLASIVAGGYLDKRNILVLSDRTSQLVLLKRKLVKEYGIPAKDVGVHVGSYETGKFRCTVTFRHDKQIISRQAADTAFDSRKEAFRWASHVQLNNIAYAARKKLAKLSKQEIQNLTRTVSVNRERYKPTDKELSLITERCRIILATYGIFAEGVDVPRMDMGVEATPRGNVEQAIGRVLRLHPDKPSPVWHTINDEITKRSDMFGAPVKSYGWYFKPKERSRAACFKRQKARIVVV